MKASELIEKILEDDKKEEKEVAKNNIDPEAQKIIDYNKRYFSSLF